MTVKMREEIMRRGERTKRHMKMVEERQIPVVKAFENWTMLWLLCEER